jgi:hypothetical protein
VEFIFLDFNINLMALWKSFFNFKIVFGSKNYLDTFKIIFNKYFIFNYNYINSEKGHLDLTKNCYLIPFLLTALNDFFFWQKYYFIHLINILFHFNLFIFVAI